MSSFLIFKILPTLPALDKHLNQLCCCAEDFWFPYLLVFWPLVTKTLLIIRLSWHLHLLSTSDYHVFFGRPSLGWCWQHMFGLVEGQRLGLWSHLTGTTPKTPNPLTTSNESPGQTDVMTSQEIKSKIRKTFCVISHPRRTCCTDSPLYSNLVCVCVCMCTLMHQV